MHKKSSNFQNYNLHSKTKYCKAGVLQSFQNLSNLKNVPKVEINDNILGTKMTSVKASGLIEIKNTPAN